MSFYSNSLSDEFTWDLGWHPPLIRTPWFRYLPLLYETIAWRLLIYCGFVGGRKYPQCIFFYRLAAALHIEVSWNVPERRWIGKERGCGQFISLLPKSFLQIKCRWINDNKCPDLKSPRFGGDVPINWRANHCQCSSLVILNWSANICSASETRFLWLFVE